MSTEENKAHFRQFVENWNRGDVDAMMKTVSPNFIEHSGPPGQDAGREGARQFFESFNAAFPDHHMMIVNMIAEGETVVTHTKTRGTHTGGMFLGIPPTGKQVEFNGIDISRLQDGMEVEHWGVFDGLTVMMQLGVIPPPGQAGS